MNSRRFIKSISDRPSHGDIKCRAACHAHAADSSSKLSKFSPAGSLPRAVRKAYHTWLGNDATLATSAVGHSRQFRHVRVTSALLPIATDARTLRIGRSVPEAEVGSLKG